MPSLKSHTEPLGDRDFGAAWPIFVILVQNRRKVDDFLGNFFSGGRGGAKENRVRAAPKSRSPKGPARDLGEGLSRAPAPSLRVLQRRGGEQVKACKKMGENGEKLMKTPKIWLSWVKSSLILTKDRGSRQSDQNEFKKLAPLGIELETFRITP